MESREIKKTKEEGMDSTVIVWNRSRRINYVNPFERSTPSAYYAITWIYEEFNLELPEARTRTSVSPVMNRVETFSPRCRNDDDRGDEPRVAGSWDNYGNEFRSLGRRGRLRPLWHDLPSTEHTAYPPSFSLQFSCLRVNTPNGILYRITTFLSSWPTNFTTGETTFSKRSTCFPV